jgi:hypothetical protein
MFILDLSAKPVIDSSVTNHTHSPAYPCRTFLKVVSRSLQRLNGVLAHTSGYWCLGGRKILKCVAKHFWYICLLGRLLTQYRAGGKIEINEMGRACGAYGGG